MLKRAVFPVLLLISIVAKSQLATTAPPSGREGAMLPAIQYPAWFSDAKLGIMIHYGLYSIPSYSGKEQYAEWFYKGLISGDSLRLHFQRDVFGRDFQYFDYMKLFRAELFDGDEWMRLFKRAGARYFVFTTKHHDGFCLYPSHYTELNSMNTPAQRDFVGTLCQAARKEGLHVGLYYSLMEWTNPLFRWSIDTDTLKLQRYVTQHALPQFREIVDNYRPELIFCDGDWDFTSQQLHTPEMVKYFYDKIGPTALINNRLGNGWDFGHLTPEYSSGIQVKGRPWAECRSLARSFALNRISPLDDYLSPEELIHHFVQLVSAGGGLMLNVAPAADGHIPLLQQERLLQLGEWLRVNGEAIYGAQPVWNEEKDPETPLPVKPIGTKAARSNTMYRTDSVINFDWVRNGPAQGVSEDNFHIIWSGVIDIDEQDSYTFLLEADESAELEITNNTYKCVGRAEKGKPMALKERLKAGSYHATISYDEKDIDASCRFTYSSDKMPPTAVPARDGWKACITWQKPVMCFTRNHDNLYAIILEPLGRNIAVPVASVPSANLQVHLLGIATSFPWHYDGAQQAIIVDLSTLTPAMLPCQYAWCFRFSYE